MTETTDPTAPGQYKHEEGTWTLTSPSGVVFLGESPMEALRSEMTARIPAKVAVARIHAEMEDASEPDPAELGKDLTRAKELIVRLWKLHPSTRVMIADGARDWLTPAGQFSTPAAQWREAGEPDPHGDRYDCERAALVMGNLTDDELANGAFMNYDVRPPLDEIVAGKAHSPIAWMTAVKDRIRWLSRALERAGGRKATAVRTEDGVIHLTDGLGNVSRYRESGDGPTGIRITRIPDDLAHLRDDAPKITCDKCGRNSYGGAFAGSVCDMPQPSGARCTGILR